MKQKTFNEVMKERFGGKVYRLALTTGCSCPGRDRGTPCIFCSAEGSGYFAAPASLSVSGQIGCAKKLVAGKLSGNFAGYMAYFQSFTNTYGPVEKLRKIFLEAANHPEILAVSIATRPDCLPEEMVEMLSEVNAVKPLTVELGLQTANEKTAEFLQRGYKNEVFEDAVRRLREKGIEVVVHLIVGLPGETARDCLATAEYLSGLVENDPVNKKHGEVSAVSVTAEIEEKSSVPEAAAKICLVDGVKIQVLQVLSGTKLAELAAKDPRLVPEISLEEYTQIVKEMLWILPSDMVVHRLTGDPPKKLLISPAWTADKKKVLNYMRRELSSRVIVDSSR